MNKQNIIKGAIMAGLWAVLIIPFFVASNMFFPYISGKNFAFRIIVEIIFALWVYLAVIDSKYRPKFSWLAVSIGAFVSVMALADMFALNPMKAIWSNYERMDGLVNLVHLLMYVFVFGSVLRKEENWLWFFRSSIVASMIMIIPVINEWCGTNNIFKSLINIGSCDSVTRVSVSLGNPIYVAVFFMFNFFFALILMYKDVIVKSDPSQMKSQFDGAGNNKKQLKSIFTHWLTYAYGIAIFICAFGIWRTSTRGVILGLLGGLVVTSLIIAIFEKKNQVMKKFSVGLIVVIALMVGGFLVSRDTQFVQNNVTLKRLADISWTDVAGQGQARQYVWPMALKGFMERPLLGWGQDGFNNIFNKYYDEKMWNQEQWFDRAHNMPLDVLIAGGALGILSYLAIFVMALFVVIKRKNKFGVTEAGLIVGLLAAYFFQNLFVFDNLVSYMFFFTTLSYLYFRDTNVEMEDKRLVKADVANYVVAPILVVIFAAMMWFVNVRPLSANFELINAMRTVNTSPKTAIENFKKVFDLNTFGSPEAREQLMSISVSVANSQLDAETKQGFVELAYEQLLQQIKETPYDARYQYFTGMFLNNMNQYQMALPYLQKAVELSPKKLTMMFELAKTYGYIGDWSKALEINEYAYNLVPEYDLGKANYAFALILNGKEAEAKKILGDKPVTQEIVIRAYLVRASSFVKSGDKSLAISEIQKAAKLVPGFKEQGDTIIKGILDGSIK